MTLSRPWQQEDWSRGVGPGWRGLILPLLNFCTAHGIKVQQVKEKWGGLRFYIGPCPPEVSDTWEALLIAAEEAAARTCENCGAPGILRTGGWMKTHCDACHLAWQTRP